MQALATWARDRLGRGDRSACAGWSDEPSSDPQSSVGSRAAQSRPDAATSERDASHSPRPTRPFTALGFGPAHQSSRKARGPLVFAASPLEPSSSSSGSGSPASAGGIPASAALAMWARALQAWAPLTSSPASPASCVPQLMASSPARPALASLSPLLPTAAVATAAPSPSPSPSPFSSPSSPPPLPLAAALFAASALDSPCAQPVAQSVSLRAPLPRSVALTALPPDHPHPITSFDPSLSSPSPDSFPSSVSPLACSSAASAFDRGPAGAFIAAAALETGAGPANEGGSVKRFHTVDKELTLAQRGVAASVGALLTSLAVTPMDVVKHRWQAQASTQVRPPTHFEDVLARNQFFKLHTGVYDLWCPKCNLNPDLNPALRFTGPMDALVKIARVEGIQALWRGLSPALIMAVPATVCYFSLYDHTRIWLDAHGVAPAAAPLLAGTFSRTIATTVVSPLELIRTKAQALALRNTSWLDLVRSEISSTPFTASAGGAGGVGAAEAQAVMQQQVSRLPTFSVAAASAATAAPVIASTAPAALPAAVPIAAAAAPAAALPRVSVWNVLHLWRGLGPTLWRDVPFSAFYWVGLERARDSVLEMLVQRRSAQALAEGRTPDLLPSKQMVWLAAFLGGAASGAVASTLTHPFDVVKTRRQISLYKLPGSTFNGDQSEGTLRTLASIARSEGVRSLWIGWAPRVTKIMPSCAIMISTYECAKMVLNNQ